MISARSESIPRAVMHVLHYLDCCLYFSLGGWTGVYGNGIKVLDLRLVRLWSVRYVFEMLNPSCSLSPFQLLSILLAYL